MICSLLSAVSFAQTEREYFHFKTRIGFDDQNEGRVQDYLFDHDRKLLLVGEKSFQIWDTATLRLLDSRPHEMRMNTGYGNLVISPDGRKVIDVDAGMEHFWMKKDNKPRPAFAYDLQTGKQIAVFERPVLPIRAAEWSDYGETIVTRSNQWGGDAEISFWNGANFAYRTSIMVKGYAWHYLAHDGDSILVGIVNGRVVSWMTGQTNQGTMVRRYDTRTGSVIDELTAPNERKFRVDDGKTLVSPDEKFLAAEERGRNVLVWDLSERKLPHLPKYEIAANNLKEGITLAGLSDDGVYFFARQGRDLVSYEIASGKPGPDVAPAVAAKLESGRIFLTPDNKYRVDDYCGGATVKDLATNKTIYAIKSPCHSGDEENGSYYEISGGFVLVDASGKLLLDFQDKDKVLKKENVLRVRNLRTGDVLQTLFLSKKDIADKTRVPNWSLWGWSRKGDYFYSRTGDGVSFLVWEAQADSVN